MTHTAKIRQDTAKQYKRVRRILKSMGYLTKVKKQTERDKVINEGRY